MHTLTYDPQYAVPPGETLIEALQERDMSQAKLARRMGRPPQMINEIARGKKRITEDTALQLEMVLGIPGYFWLEREARYRQALAKCRREPD